MSVLCEVQTPPKVEIATATTHVGGGGWGGDADTEKLSTVHPVLSLLPTQLGWCPRGGQLA